jgi:Na+/melibiose symporter and related transporters
LVIFSIQPGQITTIIILAALAGLSVSTAHIMPEAIFPDVIDWDEFRSHKRREGTYYGAVSFLRKLSSAAAIFLALQILGWFGYQAPPKNALLFAQSAETVTAIRFLTGPVVAVLLLTAIFIAWRYPLSRERQHRIQKALIRRQERFATKKKERLDLQ